MMLLSAVHTQREGRIALAKLDLAFEWRGWDSGITSAALTTETMAAPVTRPCVASDYAIIVGTEATGEALVLALSDAERRITRRLAQVPAHHGCTVER